MQNLPVTGPDLRGWANPSIVSLKQRVQSPRSHRVYLALKSYCIRQNFRVGKFLRLCTKYTIHWKTFAVHQAVAIMYSTQQVIQGENFCGRLKNHKKCQSFPTRKFYRVRYVMQKWSVAKFIRALKEAIKFK